MAVMSKALVLKWNVRPQGIGNPCVTKRDGLILGFLHINKKSVVSLVAVFTCELSFSNFSLIHFLIPV